MADFDIQWQVVLQHLGLMGLAYVLALPAGWNRERHTRSAGLRTFPLVALATCGFMLVGLESLQSDEARARALEGLITGIGFIGGGAILKGHGFVTGTATAASLWSMGAIGVAVAWQRYEIAVLLSILTFITLQLLQPMKSLVRRGFETGADDRMEDRDDLDDRGG